MDKAFTGFPVIPYQEPYAIIILFLSQSNDSVKGSKISGALVKKENKTCNTMNYLKIKKTARKWQPMFERLVQPSVARSLAALFTFGREKKFFFWHECEIFPVQKGKQAGVQSGPISNCVLFTRRLPEKAQPAVHQAQNDLVQQKCVHRNTDNWFAAKGQRARSRCVQRKLAQSKEHYCFCFGLGLGSSLLRINGQVRAAAGLLASTRSFTLSVVHGATECL